MPNDNFGGLDAPQFEILSKRFAERGPYYTSYPAMGAWSDKFREPEHRAGLKQFLTGEGRDEPIHLYVHIPFCAKLCYYCICNMTVTDDRSRIRDFVTVLVKETQMLRRFFDEVGVQPKIREIHFGGGTPSYLDREEFKQVCDALSTITDLKALDEFAMEIDPRTTDPESLLYFASFGVNRISFGVQDFDADVQLTINRVQPYEMVDNLLTTEVRKAFNSINFDILYGLPKQTRETFAKTVEQVKKLAPTRVSLLKYAHVPDVRKHMRVLKDDDMPPVADLPLMYLDSTAALLAGGFKWVGIDYFAKSGDALAVGVEKDTLWRNFNGYSPGRTRNIIGLGPTSSMAFGPHYSQSFFELKDYYQAVNSGQFPILRGYTLSPDDLIRREAIFQIICRQKVDLRLLGDRFGVDGPATFAAELKALAEQFEADGIVKIDGPIIQITEFGRYFIRNVCRVFDTFFREKTYSIPRPFLKGNRSVL